MAGIEPRRDADAAALVKPGQAFQDRHSLDRGPFRLQTIDAGGLREEAHPRRGGERRGASERRRPGPEAARPPAPQTMAPLSAPPSPQNPLPPPSPRHPP